MNIIIATQLRRTTMNHGFTTKNDLLYRVGEGAGLAAVLVSILLWGSIAGAWLR